MRAFELIDVARNLGVLSSVYHCHEGRGFRAKGENAEVSVVWFSHGSALRAMCSMPGDDDTEDVEVLIVGRDEPDGWVPCQKVAALLAML